MAVSKQAKNLYNAIFDGTETFAANCISRFGEVRDLKKYAPKEPIPKDYAKDYKAYWKQFGIHASPEWGWYYAARNGVEDVRYVPHTLYYTKIDQHFNARKLGYGFNDKNYYSCLFPDIPQPKTVVRKIGGLLFDAEYRQIDPEKAIESIGREKEIIAKPSQESGSGRGIAFFNPETDSEAIREYLGSPADGNCILQSIVPQHPALEKVHAGSLNTIRICTLMLDDGVHVLSSVLRMGVDKSRIDNVTAGGISAPIGEDGKLGKYAYTYYSGEKFEAHPQGLVFDGYEIPSFDRVIETVKSAAQRIGNFRLVSWDMAVDAAGEVLLVEANMRKGGINLHQFDNGPLFGDLTERVIREVLKK